MATVDGNRLDDDESKTFFFCGLCYTTNPTSRDPRILPCSHAFCRPCLDSENIQVGLTYYCPTCNSSIIWPEFGCYSFPKLKMCNTSSPPANVAIRPSLLKFSTGSFDSNVNMGKNSRLVHNKASSVDSAFSSRRSSHCSIEQLQQNNNLACEVVSLQEYFRKSEAELLYRLEKQAEKARREIDKQSRILKQKVRNMFDEKRLQADELHRSFLAIQLLPSTSRIAAEKTYATSKRVLLSSEPTLDDYRVKLGDLIMMNKKNLKVNKTFIQIPKIQYVAGMQVFNQHLYIAQFETMEPSPKSSIIKYTLDGKHVENCTHFNTEIAAFAINVEGTFFVSDIINKKILQSTNHCREFIHFIDITEGLGMATHDDQLIVASCVVAGSEKVSVYKYSKNASQMWRQNFTNEISVWKLVADQSRVLVLHPKDYKISILNTFTGYRMSVIDLSAYFKNNSQPLGISLMPNNGLAVSGMNSNNLHVFDSDGKHFGETKIEKFSTNLTLLDDVLFKYIYINYFTNFKVNIIKAIKIEKAIELPRNFNSITNSPVSGNSLNGSPLSSSFLH